MHMGYSSCTAGIFDTVVDRLLWEMQVPKLEIPTIFSPKKIRAPQSQAVDWRLSRWPSYLIQRRLVARERRDPPLDENKISGSVLDQGYDQNRPKGRGQISLA
jgi:hypothetical protein